MQTVKCGSFVKRQIPESGYSHYIHDWPLLEMEASLALEHRPDLVKPGYRDGVVLVESLFPERFRSAIVELDEESKLTANYAPRRPKEAPFIRVSAKAQKQVATHASVVLYRADVLEESGERETDADWEIVCIKARVGDEEEPMMPYTMARNFLQLDGGTKGSFTAEEFAHSIVYWNNHCMLQSRSGIWTRLSNWLFGKCPDCLG